MATVQGIMLVMQETTLFEVLAPNRKWIFDPVGVDYDTVTGAINKGATHCLCHAYHIAIHVTTRVCVYVPRWIDV